MARPLLPHQLPDGRWLVRQRGEPRQYFADKEGATKWIDEIERRRLAIRTVPGHRGDLLLFGEYWDRYVARQLDWSSTYRTQVNYQARSWVLPYLGDYPLNALTYQRAAGWLEWLQASGATAAVIKQLFAMTGGCLTEAIKLREYTAENRNPFHGHPLPEYRAPRPQFSLELVEAFAIKKQLAPLQSLALSLTGFLGLRNGEVHRSDTNAHGLGWIDLIDVRTGKAHDVLRLTRTKSLRGDRDVDIWAIVREEIEVAWRHVGRPQDGSAFLNSRGKPITSRAFHRYHFEPALLAAGFEADEYEVHDLRDMTANMFGRAHWPMGDGAAYLGHSETVHEKHYKTQFRLARRQPAKSPDDQLDEAAKAAGYNGLLAHSDELRASFELQQLYRRHLRTRRPGVPLPTRDELLEELRRGKSRRAA